KKLGIRTITDLRTHPDLRVAITHEFLERKDGWKPLVQKYGLKMSNVRGVEHTLGYEALASGEADVKDAYSTDAKLIDPQFTILKDDLNYFPAYQAVLLYRLDLPANVISVLKSLEGHIDEKLMVAMNAEAEKSKDYTKAATLAFVGTTSASGNSGEKMEAEHLTSKLVRWTLQHLKLVMISLLAAVLVGIPLGVYAARGGVGGQIVLSVVGMIQTIPSLALLALLVPLPFFGISSTTAIVALFLYSLLPIVRNTATGLQDIPQNIRESAEALGMDQSSILRKIYLPLASRSILSGIKTSAVINVGTATLAALIGAGGFGEPIVSGLSLNDNATILQGAIPAAILALLVQFGFDRLDNLIIPKGLRLKNRVEN
ncbi:MAG: ABC transporter permease subunit, partial [Chthonomonadales bacterium]